MSPETYLNYVRTIHPVDLARIRRFRNLHKGKDFVILGSGHSLNNYIHSDQFITISVNAAYKKQQPNYMVTIDQCFPDFADSRLFASNNNIPYFISWNWIKWPEAEEYLRKYNNELSIPSTNTEFDFSDDSKLWRYIKDVYEREGLIECGVTSLCSGVAELAIPLAFYMGASRVFLLGVDFPKEVTTSNHHFNNDQRALFDIELDRWKDIPGNKYGSGSIWDVKRASIEIIKDTNKDGKVFNLSPVSTIQNIPKVSMSDFASLMNIKI